MSRKNPSTLEYKAIEPTPSHGIFIGLLVHLRVAIVATIVTLVIVSGIYPAIVWGLSQALFHNKANGSLVARDGTGTTDDGQAVGSSLLGQPFTAAGYFHPRPSAAGSGYDPTQSGGSNYGPLSDKLINGATNPATTQPTTQPESLAYDGIRLRTIHYAVDNNINFHLYNVTITPDGAQSRTPVAIAKFQDAQGNLNDIALVDAFPHNGATAGLVAADFATPIPADAVTASASGLDPHITPANAELQKNRVASIRKISPDQVEALITANTDGPSLGFLGEAGVNVLMLNLALDAKYPVQTAPSPAQR